MTLPDSKYWAKLRLSPCELMKCSTCLAWSQAIFHTSWRSSKHFNQLSTLLIGHCKSVGDRLILLDQPKREAVWTTFAVIKDFTSEELKQETYWFQEPTNCVTIQLCLQLLYLSL